MQSARNRDTAAIELKLDELLRATKSARNKLMNIEDQTKAELHQIKEELILVVESGGAGLAEIDEVTSRLEEVKVKMIVTEYKI